MSGLLVEIAGVAGHHIAVGRHRFGGLGGILEVAGEHAGRLEQHLAVVGDADVDVRAGRAHGVGIDFAVRLRGDVEEGLGLPVELLQIETDRAIEREQIGADGFARGIGHAHAREAEHVLERAIEQDIADRIEQPADERHGLAIEDAFAIAPRHADEIVEQLALDIAGILHADHHAREQSLERARRREIEARADLAQVGHHSLGALRAGHAEAGDQALRIVQVMIADPGQRQIGERHVLFGQVIEGDGVGGGLDRAFAGKHHALGGAGGARGVQDDGRIGALAGGDLGIEPTTYRRIGERLAAGRDDVLHRMQLFVVVVAQAALLVVDHLLELRQPLLDRKNLVDLFLVLDRRVARLGMGQHEGEFLGHRIRIDRHRDGPQHLRGHHRPIEFRPVGADDGDGFAAFKAEPVEADGIGAHDFERLSPSPGLPDAEVLMPH